MEFMDSVCNSEAVIVRWNRCLSAFLHAFGDMLSFEPRSFMAERLSFNLKETRFRRDMDKVILSSKFDLSLEVCIIFCLSKIYYAILPRGI